MFSAATRESVVIDHIAFVREAVSASRKSLSDAAVATGVLDVIGLYTAYSVELSVALRVIRNITGTFVSDKQFIFTISLSVLAENTTLATSTASPPRTRRIRLAFILRLCVRRIFWLCLRARLVRRAILAVIYIGDI
jgi:hypothetical protein